MFCWEENEAKKGKPTWYFLEGFTDAIDWHPGMREGYARYHMYTQLPVYLNPQDLIVGNLNWSIYKEIIFNNVGSQVISEELLDSFLKRDDVSEAEKEEVKRRVEQIRPYTMNEMQDRLPEELKAVSKSTAADSTWFNGHMVFDYERILSEGLNGYRRRLQQYRNRAQNREDYFFYKGLLYALEGMQEFIFRHALMAECLIQRGEPGYDTDRLLRIAANCRKVSQEAPESLEEALQLVWFIFCFGDYDSYGRFDQYMLPFYEKDRKRLSEDGVRELLSFFLKKGEENRGILNMTIGGKRPDGSSGVTEFTYLLMDVIRSLGFKSPNLFLRISAGSEERLYRKAHENLAGGQAIPALYNDDVIIPMLLELGYPDEEANNYCLAGCSQVVLPGRSNFSCDVGVYNALKMLEITLHEGWDILQKKRVGVCQPPVTEITSYEELYERYLEQMRYLTDCGVRINDADILSRKGLPSSVRTLFIRDCLEKGKGIYEGGARYSCVQNEVIGLTNVANALMVIKRLVFEQKKFTLSELIGMADHNYAGYEKEHKIIMDVPKFGNDEECVDEIRKQVGMDFYRYLGSKEGILGKQWAGEVIFQSHINLAPFTMASLDGRSDFEPLADSAGAMRGTDLQGPTALIKSFCKIPVTAPTVSRNLNIRFPKDLFGRQPEKICALFRSFMKLGGVQMQINVLDKEELKEAQIHPEQYKNLVVRIGGYNDYFVEIPKHMQDEVIARTEQQI